MEMIIEKTLVTPSGKKFNLFDDIAFTYTNKETDHLERVIGRIVYIDDVCLDVDKVEINRFICNPEVEYRFWYDDMDDVNYVV